MERTFSGLKSGLKTVLKLLTVVLAFWGVLNIEPVKRWRIELFGSDRDKAALSYLQRMEESRKDSLAQIQWYFEKGLQDSLVQAKKKDMECIRQEIDFAESNPCQSTLVYSIGDSWRGWYIGSSKCNDWMAGEFHRGFPLDLLDERWRKRNIRKYIHSVKASEINKILGKCP